MMDSNKNTARLAGFTYLIVILTGIFSLAYVPSRLIDWNDAAKTFQNINDSQELYRLSLLAGVICYVAFLFLPLVLYQLLRGVNELAAKSMVVLAIVSVPISILNLQNKYAALSLVSGADYLKRVDTGQLQSQMMIFLDNYDNGILIVQVFWWLWLLPFGYLVYQSKFLPRILGVLLMLGCFGYLIQFAGQTLMTDFGKTSLVQFITLPATLGEIGTCLWLLINGRKMEG